MGGDVIAPGAGAAIALFPGIAFGLVFIFFFGFVFFIWRRILSAYKSVPAELKGIRQAIERLADAAERRN